MVPPFCWTTQPSAVKLETDHLNIRSVRMVASSRGRRPAGVQKTSCHSRGLRPSCRQPRWVVKAKIMNNKTECTLAQKWSQRLLHQLHASSSRRAQALRLLPSSSLAQARLLRLTSTSLAQVRPTSFMLAQAIQAPLSSTPKRTVFSTSGRILIRTPSSMLAQVPQLPIIIKLTVFSTSGRIMIQQPSSMLAQVPQLPLMTARVR